MFDLKSPIINYKWWNNFKFSIEYSSNGVARIYIGERKTKYNSGGYGYCKESDVIAKMINDITVPTKYNSEVYGNREGRISQGGVGFDSVKNSFESKRGNKLNKLYSGKTYDVYEITINPKYTIKG